MTKDFNDIVVGDKIYFIPTDDKNETYQEIEVKEITNVYRYHYGHRSCCETSTNTKYIGNDGVDIEVRNEFERSEDDDGSIRLNEVAPHSPIAFASMRVGDQVTFGIAATKREFIGTCDQIFDRGYKLAQRHIKEKYLAFTDAMGMERPYQPPQRLC